MPKAVLTAALLLCAGPVFAEDKVTPPPQKPPANAPVPPAPRPLSKEDAELVKQLALLEQLDLVRNLELFEPKPDDKPAEASQRQP